jgi:hypothetical protein
MDAAQPRKEERGFCARFRANPAAGMIANALRQISCDVGSRTPQVAMSIRRKALSSLHNKNFRQAHWRALYA